MAIWAATTTAVPTTPTRTIPGVVPSVEPQPARRLTPGETCPNQRRYFPEIVRRHLT